MIALWLKWLWMVPALLLMEEPASSGLIFSHSLHRSQLAMECRDCHAGILQSSAASDLNFPGKESCSRCHDVRDEAGCTQCHALPVAAPDHSNRFRNLSFNHLVHVVGEGEPSPSAVTVGLGAEDSERCLFCHSGVLTDSPTTLVRYPAMGDCMGCHQPARAALRECGTCHLDTGNLKPESHAHEEFFDAHAQTVAVSGSQECRMCHTPGFNPCSQCH